MAVLLLTVSGQRFHGWDVALLVLSLFVLGSVTSGYVFPSGETASYTMSKTSLNASRVDVTTTAVLGSITILFSNMTDLAYRVNFTNPAWSPLFSSVPSGHSFTNQTRDGTLFLRASSNSSSMTVTLGKGYLVSINASTDAGGIDITAPAWVTLGRLDLSTGAGSINARVDSQVLSGLTMKTGTGSIDLSSSGLTPSAAKVPVTLSTGTGSISFDATVSSDAAVLLSAKTGLGSIDQSLRGFTITSSSSVTLEAAAGDMASAATSLVITASTGLGSITLRLQR